jgi:ubiquinone/menaquinone biosynthesis C-methylase UbiE
MSEILKETERQKYERYWLEPGERVNSPAMRAMDEFIEKAREAEIVSILDLGCGMGRSTVALLDAGFDACACDIAHNCLNDDIRDLLGERFTPGPMWDIPFDDDYFDCVFCVDVLEHIPEDLLGDALHEVARVAPLAYVEWATFDRVVAGLHVHMTVHPNAWWAQALSVTHDVIRTGPRSSPKTAGGFAWLERRGG